MIILQQTQMVRQQIVRTNIMTRNSTNVINGNGMNISVESEKHGIRIRNDNLLPVSPNVMSSNDNHINGKSVAMQNLINNTNIGITLRTNTHTLQAISHSNDIDNDSTIANPSVHNMEPGTKITNVEESLRALTTPGIIIIQLDDILHFDNIPPSRFKQAIQVVYELYHCVYILINKD